MSADLAPGPLMPEHQELHRPTAGKCCPCCRGKEPLCLKDFSISTRVKHSGEIASRKNTLLVAKSMGARLIRDLPAMGRYLYLVLAGSICLTSSQKTLSPCAHTSKKSGTYTVPFHLTKADFHMTWPVALGLV